MGNKGPNVLSSFRASRIRRLLKRFSRWLNRAIDVELRGEHSCELSPRAFVPLGQRREKKLIEDQPPTFVHPMPFDDGDFF